MKLKCAPQCGRLWRRVYTALNRCALACLVHRSAFTPITGPSARPEFEAKTSA
jgi:hypothetical protein